jgi:branched-chain amino acid transport system substrate-binding protein
MLRSFSRSFTRTSAFPGGTGGARRLAGGAALALALSSACSAIVDTEADQCSTDADCQAKGAAFAGTVCSAQKTCVKSGSAGGSGGSGGSAGGGGSSGQTGCTTNKECSTLSGDANQICRKSDGTCVALTSQDCTQVLGAVENDETIVLGFLGPLVGEYASIGLPILAGAALARSEIETRANGLPGGTGGKRRPLAIVACHDLDDPVRAAEHLVKTVGVQAILGPAFSGVTLKVTTDVTVPNGVLTMSASATSPAITQLEDNGLAWRAVPSDAIQAIPMSFLAGQIESSVRQKLGLAAGDKIRVAMTVKGDAYGTGLAEAILPQLSFNGKPAIDASNSEQFLRVDYPDEATFDFAPLLNQVVSFKPHMVIVLGTNEGIQKVTTGIEAAWPTTGTPPPRPSYLFPDGGRLPELLSLVGTDNDDLRKRIIGTVPGRKGPLYDAFRIRFKAANKNEEPGTYAENAYDAVYLLGYALSATAGEPVTGANIAKGLAKLIPPGTQIDSGPNALNDAFTTLKTGNNIDFNGASGPLDFDLNTGEASADIDIWCIVRDSNKNPVFKSSGQYYDAVKKQLAGTSACDLPRLAGLPGPGRRGGGRGRRLRERLDRPAQREGHPRPERQQERDDLAVLLVEPGKHLAHQPQGRRRQGRQDEQVGAAGGVFPAAGDADAEPHQRHRPRGALEQVLVAVGHLVVGVRPEHQEDQPEQPQDKPQRCGAQAERHPGGLLPCHRAQRRQPASQRRASHQEDRDAPGGFGADRGAIGVQEPVLALHQGDGLAIFPRDLCLPEGLLEASGQEHLFPDGDGLVDQVAHGHLETEVNGPVVGDQAHGVGAPGHPSRSAGDLPHLASGNKVDRVPHPGRAVVPVVVVLVVAVLGSGVLLQGIDEALAEGRGEGKLLGVDGAVLPAVSLDGSPEGLHREPVAQLPLEEDRDQRRGVEGEGSEVVDPVGVAPGVVHQDGVVPELEERVIAGPEGQHRDRVLVAGFGAAGRRGEEGRRPEDRRQDARSHAGRTLAHPTEPENSPILVRCGASRTSILPTIIADSAM